MFIYNLPEKLRTERSRVLQRADELVEDRVCVVVRGTIADAGYWNSAFAVVRDQFRDYAIDMRDATGSLDDEKGDWSVLAACWRGDVELVGEFGGIGTLQEPELFDRSHGYVVVPAARLRTRAAAVVVRNATITRTYHPQSESLRSYREVRTWLREGIKGDTILARTVNACLDRVENYRKDIRARLDNANNPEIVQAADDSAKAAYDSAYNARLRDAQRRDEYRRGQDTTTRRQCRTGLWRVLLGSGAPCTNKDGSQEAGGS